MAKPSRRLDLSVQYAADGAPPRADVRRWVRTALTGGGQITVRFVDADEGRSLNRDYRGKDYATNVLSFPYETSPIVLGDLVICPAVVAREAAEQGKAPADHYAHLVIHGTLHLQGFDHETDATAADMEARETVLLAGLGIGNPYLD